MRVANYEQLSKTTKLEKCLLENSEIAKTKKYAATRCIIISQLS